MRRWPGRSPICGSTTSGSTARSGTSAAPAPAEVGEFALTGRYTGSLQRLTPFTGDIGAVGDVDAPIRALATSEGITVQTSDARMRDGSVRGVPLGDAAGTLAIGKTVRVVAASAMLGGARAVAASQDGNVAFSAVGIQATALRGAGVPLQAGQLSLFGIADLHGPTFRGSVDLDRGDVDGLPLAGWVQLNFDRTALEIAGGTAALGTTYARVGGRVVGIGRPDFHYTLNANVPLGDVGALVEDAHVPSPYPIEGSFSAQLRARGSGGRLPNVAGTVEVPEGVLNGLAFRDAGGRLLVEGDPTVRLDEGHVTVGSTRSSFSAELTPGLAAARVDSPAMTLRDFNGFFDQSSMLDGTGMLRASFAEAAGGLSSSGVLALRAARLARFPLGTVAATWSTTAGRIQADASFAGTAGAANYRGTLQAGPGMAGLMHLRLNGAVHGAGLDLGTWLPAAGITYPILGRLDADGQVSGTFPHLVLGGTAAVAQGQVGPYHFQNARVRTHVAEDRVAVDEAGVDFPFGTLSASGSVSLAAGEPLALRLHASIPQVRTALTTIVPHNAINLAGALEVDTLVSGNVAHPQLTTGFDFQNGELDNVAIPRASGEFESDLRSVRLDDVDIAFERGSASLAGALPISLVPFGLGPRAAPLSLTLEANAIDLAPFGRFLPGDGTKLGGLLAGRLAVEGSVGAPRILGGLQLRGGSYVSSVETAPIRNLDASATFEGTSVALQALDAQVGNGTLTASGRLALPILGASSNTWALNLSARGATFNLPAYGAGQIDGTAELAGGERVPTLSGDLTLSNTTIPFDALIRAAGAGGTALPSSFDLAFNLQLTAGKNVRVRSPIVDVSAGGTVALSGTLSDPRASGQLSAGRGGYFSTYQRLFRVQNATVTFDPNQGIVPNLDLHATTYVSNPDPDPLRNPIGSAIVNVAVTGPADSYTVTFSSQPPYSEEQILALLSSLPVGFSSPYGLSGTSLRGAPGESNVLLPPGNTPYSTGGFTFQSEAFSLLNTQLTQRLLSPLETFLGAGLGLTDFEITLDPAGRIGYVASQLVSKPHDVTVQIGQVLSYPTSDQASLQYRFDPVTTLAASYFKQNGSLFYQNSIFGSTSTITVQNGVQPLSNRQGFDIRVIRTYP